MGTLLRLCKSVVAALLIAAGTTAGAQPASPEELQSLLEQLADPDTRNWQQIERRIHTEWSRSGSPAMDLLLMRAREAMEAEEWDAALEHLTALTDHAPDFAEGFSDRATVYFRRQLYGPALQDIARVLALNPRHFNALSGLAIILEETGDKRRALEAWRLLAEVHPHRPETQQAIERLDKETGGQPI
jgi:tetratricopeptide (TPR) repeat protein